MKLHIEKFITGLIIIFLSVLMYIVATNQIQNSTLAGVSPQAIPHLVAKLIFFTGCIMLIQSSLLSINERKSEKYTYSKAKFIKFPFFIFSIMILYTVTMFYLGYLIASFTILPLMMYVMKERKLTNYLIIAGLIIFIYIVIDVLLNIRLPKLGLFGII